MDFSAAAVRYSDSPNALEGGDLGWRSMDEIPAAFAALVKNMKAGDVTAPLRGASGYQLLKLVEVRDEAQSAGGSMVTQVHARHILIRVNDTVTEAAAKAKIDTIAARLKGGADFAQVAREESQDLSSQTKGGDLGLVRSGAVRHRLRRPGGRTERRPDFRSIPYRRRLAHRPTRRNAPN
jgi:peptidyl-prolyl cis-trans isomerase SurA